MKYTSGGVLGKTGETIDVEVAIKTGPAPAPDPQGQGQSDPGPAPADGEEKRYLWVKGIIESTEVKNWKTGAVLGKAKFEADAWKMNLLALRGWVDGQGKVDNADNKWNDTIYVAYLDGEGKRRCEAFISTTDPGHLKLEDLNPAGVAHLLDNQVRFKRGYHHRSKPSKRIALQQYEPFYYWRSLDQHGERKGDEPISLAFIGINNHDAFQSGSTVGNSSEGCQVIKGDWTVAQVKRYFWLMSKDPTGVIKYTLRDGGDVPDGAAHAALKPGYDETAARTPQLTGKDDSSWTEVGADTYAARFYDDASGPKG
jgi:hypothetical protein